MSGHEGAWADECAHRADVLAEQHVARLVGRRVHQWDDDDPWPFTGTIEAVEGARLTIRWDHDPDVLDHQPALAVTIIDPTPRSQP